MLDKLSPEARHLMLLLIGAVIAWASTELPTQLNPLAASLLGAITTAALAEILVEDEEHCVSPFLGRSL